MLPRLQKQGWKSLLTHWLVFQEMCFCLRMGSGLNLMLEFTPCSYSMLFDDYHYNLPVALNPSCLQATVASSVPQRSSHTVPQTLLLQTSTRPSLAFRPPRSLIVLPKQPMMLTVSYCSNSWANYSIAGKFRR